MAGPQPRVPKLKSRVPLDQDDEIGSILGGINVQAPDFQQQAPAPSPSPSVGIGEDPEINSFFTSLKPTPQAAAPAAIDQQAFDEISLAQLAVNNPSEALGYLKNRMISKIGTTDGEQAQFLKKVYGDKVFVKDGKAFLKTGEGKDKTAIEFDPWGNDFGQILADAPLDVLDFVADLPAAISSGLIKAAGSVAGAFTPLGPVGGYAVASPIAGATSALIQRELKKFVDITPESSALEDAGWGAVFETGGELASVVANKAFKGIRSAFGKFQKSLPFNNVKSVVDGIDELHKVAKDLGYKVTSNEEMAKKIRPGNENVYSALKGEFGKTIQSFRSQAQELSAGARFDITDSVDSIKNILRKDGFEFTEEGLVKKIPGPVRKLTEPEKPTLSTIVSPSGTPFNISQPSLAEGVEEAVSLRSRALFGDQTAAVNDAIDVVNDIIQSQKVLGGLDSRSLYNNIEKIETAKRIFEKEGAPGSIQFLKQVDGILRAKEKDVLANVLDSSGDGQAASKIREAFDTYSKSVDYLDRMSSIIEKDYKGDAFRALADGRLFSLTNPEEMRSLKFLFGDTPLWDELRGNWYYNAVTNMFKNFRGGRINTETFYDLLTGGVKANREVIDEFLLPASQKSQILKTLNQLNRLDLSNLARDGSKVDVIRSALSFSGLANQLSQQSNQLNVAHAFVLKALRGNADNFDAFLQIHLPRMVQEGVSEQEKLAFKNLEKGMTRMLNSMDRVMNPQTGLVEYQPKGILKFWLNDLDKPMAKGALRSELGRGFNELFSTGEMGTEDIIQQEPVGQPRPEAPNPYFQDIFKVR